MRSGVGAFCPRSRRPDLLEVLLRCAAPPDLDEAVFFGVALCACAEFVNTPAPAATSSVRARWVAFRARMIVCVLAVPGCLLLIGGRNFPRQQERVHPVTGLPSKHLEDDILAMLQFLHGLPLLYNGSH